METEKNYLWDNYSPKSSDLTDKGNINTGWTGLLILAGVATTIGSAVPIGWCIGVLNTPSTIIKGWLNETMTTRYDIEVTSNIMEFVWSSLVSIYLISGMIGSFTGAWLANLIGRKNALIVASVLSIATAIMFVSARPLMSVELMFVARFFSGLGAGLAMAVMPTYLSELAPLELRGAVGVLCPLGVTFGVVFAQVFGLPEILGTYENWHYLLGFYGLLSLLEGFAFPLLPESPKYLAISGNKQKAMKELTRLRNLPEEFVCCELNDDGESTSECWSFAKFLSTRSLWMNTALVCAFNFGQQFSGINAVFYYSVSIFESAGLSEKNAKLANLAAGVMNFAIAVIMIPLINLFGRRTLSLLSCSLATICLIMLCFCISFMNKISWLSYLSIVSVLSYVLVYGFALGPVPYFIGTELFDVGPRPIAMAMGTASNWIGNLAVGLFFPTLQTWIGPYSFLVFASSTALLTVFIKICLPETNVNIIAKTRRNSTLPTEKF